MEYLQILKLIKMTSHITKLLKLKLKLKNIKIKSNWKYFKYYNSNITLKPLGNSCHVIKPRNRKLSKIILYHGKSVVLKSYYLNYYIILTHLVVLYSKLSWYLNLFCLQKIHLGLLPSCQM